MNKKWKIFFLILGCYLLLGILLSASTTIMSISKYNGDDVQGWAIMFSPFTWIMHFLDYVFNPIRFFTKFFEYIMK